ncbi:MAG: HAMP domain-containing protein [Treponema sp.]|nr:HAMP domain-containing protein [Treponema sp.]
MKIRSKIILVVLPLLITALCLAQGASYYSARRGITRIAQEFMSFKASELEKYAEGQWNLLVEHEFTARPEMIEAAKYAVQLYALSIILNDTELILALDDEGNVAMSSAPLSLGDHERDQVMEILWEGEGGINQAVLGGESRVFSSFYFVPFRWYILLTEEQSAYYEAADRIRFQTLVALAASSLAAGILLIIFSQYLTKPLAKVVEGMNKIRSGADLSSRVDVEYQDETGRLAATFNVMIGELDHAYAQIKRYAFEAVLAGRREQRIRGIFQKYVPKDLIDRFFAAPDSMLVGENRELAVLFSDIRSFTSISEKMAPDELVSSLNRYFSGQVDIIMNRQGIVDKYIGDGIMAFWGAPVSHDDDALQSVLAGLDMIESVKTFNEQQRRAGKPEFKMGIGINYGTVTVGNIGSERKMDYTVIGDMVNLASRMEGLNKNYQTEILISDAIYDALGKNPEQIKQGALSFRLLDTVAVKGKMQGVRVYSTGRSLEEEKRKAWAYHNRGMDFYYQKDFAKAARHFSEVLSLLPGDFQAAALLERCKVYMSAPPPSSWDGTEVMETK